MHPRQRYRYNGVGFEWPSFSEIVGGAATVIGAVGGMVGQIRGGGQAPIITAPSVAPPAAPAAPAAPAPAAKSGLELAPGFLLLGGLVILALSSRR